MSFRYAFAISICACLIFFSEGYFLHLHFSKDISTDAMSSNVNKSLSLQDLFNSDFPGLAKVAMEVDVDMLGYNSQHLIVAKYIDWNSSSYFLSFFLSQNQNAFENAIYLSDMTAVIVSQLAHFTFSIQDGGDSRQVKESEMSLSKELYIYTQNELTLQEKYDLTACYLIYGFNLHIRSLDYLTIHQGEHNRLIKGPDPRSGAIIELPTGTNGMTVAVANNTDSSTKNSIILPNVVPRCSKR